jgi:addiction module HigA family antidote
MLTRLKLPITIKEKHHEKTLHPVHSGEVLSEEFLKPMNLSQNRLALSVGVRARRINEIVLRKRSVSADTALRLGRFFGISPEFWLGLQAQYDLDVTAGERLELEVRTYAVNK